MAIVQSNVRDLLETAYRARAPRSSLMFEALKTSLHRADCFALRQSWVSQKSTNTWVHLKIRSTGKRYMLSDELLSVFF